MNRALLDALRCPGGHAESWLVSLARVVDGSSLVEGELACPLCGAEYRVQNGVGIFGSLGLGSSGESIGPNERSSAALSVERLAAQLAVIGGRDPVLFHGRYAQLADQYTELTETPVIIVGIGNMVQQNTSHNENVSVLQVGERLPLGAGTLAGAAIDLSNGGPQLLAGVAAALRQNARLVLPAAFVIPETVLLSLRELARDESEWVGECTAQASGLVALRRQPPPV